MSKEYEYKQATHLNRTYLKNVYMALYCIAISFALLIYKFYF